jgi:hypothetical protein
LLIPGAMPDAGKLGSRRREAAVGDAQAARGVEAGVGFDEVAQRGRDRLARIEAAGDRGGRSPAHAA